MITLRNEGALLPLEMLSRIASEDKGLAGLGPESYGLYPGERLRDAVNRAWNGLLARWRAFCVEREKLPAGDTGLKLTRDRWLFPLFNELGFGRQLAKAPEETLNGRVFAISHRWQNTPIHITGFRTDLDASQKLSAGGRVSPHGHLQAFLNSSEECLWGMLSNGLVLRILRDHHRLTQRASIEFDLQAMMDGEHFSDFSLLYLLCHQSRFAGEKGEDCYLEQWHKTAQEEGIRALEGLREGVKKAIEALGSGFLKQKKHAANQALAQSLREGLLGKQEYYHQLLQWVYRLIFWFVAEDRDVLLDPQAPEDAKERYRRYYSSKRLRDLAGRKRGGPHVDGWRGFCMVLDRLYDGCPELGLPALGSDLWRGAATRDLKHLDLANEDLYSALYHLCHKQQKDARYAISFKNIGSEELGSVYESLLELHPELDVETGRFELMTVVGNERKTTGSYYTPRSLVDCLLDSALSPVLEEACKQANAEEAILDLKICDPACGSGHFLVAAARRVALKLAALRSGGDEPSPRELQRALRDVVGRCMYGVDLNPMAVELCKVSLWMEGMEAGRPLRFLESHVRQGNALLGATPALMEKGILDEAFEVLEGDEKDVAKRLKKRNREARKTGQLSMMGGMAEAPASYGRLLVSARAVEEASDETLGEVVAKEEEWERYTGSEAYQGAQFLADAWCASFVWEKRKAFEDAAVTEDLWVQLKAHGVGSKIKFGRTWKEVGRLAGVYSFFHWHLAFPQVFFGEGEKGEAGWSGGFDVVLGNPPWERVKLQEQEFFAARSEKIVKAANAAARKKLIAALPAEDPELWKAWCRASREAEGQSHFVRVSGRYPLCSRGDINTYAVFAETMQMLLGAAGRVGCVLPTGIATDETTKLFFQDVMAKRALISLFDFENKGIFHEIDDRYKFCLFTLGRGAHLCTQTVELIFFAHATNEIEDPKRRFTLSAEDIALLNPNTRTCPVFRSCRDAELTKAIYRRVPILIHRERDKQPEVNPWNIRLNTMFHMSNDSHLFRTREQLIKEGWIVNGNRFCRDRAEYLPLYEGRFGHQFNHRFASQPGGEVREFSLTQLLDPTCFIEPQYWVGHEDANEQLSRRAGKCRTGLLGFRRVARDTDERTCIAAIIPWGPASYGWILSSGPNALGLTLLCGIYNSFAFDYLLRSSLSQPSIPQGTFEQVPTIVPTVFEETCPWDNSQPFLRDWIIPRVLELTYTAWDLEPFAKDIGYNTPPFRWDPERRFLLRAELDAAFFHLYGLSLDDSAYILDTFPIVRKNDEKTYGHYRTKTQILSVYTAMAQAIQQNTPYSTILTPPPADPSQMHPPKAPAPG